MSRRVIASDSIDPCDLDDPLVLCGWKALLDGLRVINEKDPLLKEKLTEGGGMALAEFVGYKRDITLRVNFPNWKPTKEYPTDRPVEPPSDFDDEMPIFAGFDQFEAEQPVEGPTDAEVAEVMAQRKQMAADAQARFKAKHSGPPTETKGLKTPKKVKRMQPQQSKPNLGPCIEKTCPCGKPTSHRGWCDYHWQEALKGNIIKPT